MREAFRGCLLGGAVGDALGAPVEFMSLSEIKAKYGEGGIRDFDFAYGGKGLITDDTQMTLFTAEGLLRSMLRTRMRGIGGAHVHLVKAAYLRWLQTQGRRAPREFEQREEGNEPGWLIGHRELFAARGPGLTCLEALACTPHDRLFAQNDSKGCGGVMRMAPAALFAVALGVDDDGPVFGLGMELAAITHGHPTGQVAAGAFAVMLAHIFRGAGLWAASDAGVAAARRHPDGGETATALSKAISLAETQEDPARAMAGIGEGWVAEEALALATFAALAATDFEGGVRIAVNINGDSDSVGAITGNLLGAAFGEAAIPMRWLKTLELRTSIGDVAEDFLRIAVLGAGESIKPEEVAYWLKRYPA